MSHFLIIKATEDVTESQLCFLVGYIESLGNSLDLFDLDDSLLKDIINNSESTFLYDYIYIISHGNDEFFGDDNGSTHSWFELSQLIEKSKNFAKDTTLIIKSCYGGNSNVAKSIFENCNKIKYVFGIDGEVQNFDMFVSSMLLLYYILWKNKSIESSVSLSNSATELNAVIFNRDSFKTF
ncbi:MAG: hypothetical protein CMC05_11425 [Flavobacteriaceae bacterium]|nr:hypothetical protein [Flavobacteriaceae bacterium]MBD10018.1 hypothetical protein [Flavobacteriaceae bacterium]|tara:strand:- start:3050 stop:3592 length:543 start_codon:yes stop_codon:yes gene_type:complete